MSELSEIDAQLDKACADGRMTVGDADAIREFAEFLAHDCPWCPRGCVQCVGDRDCECYAHQDEPDRHLSDPPAAHHDTTDGEVHE